MTQRWVRLTGRPVSQEEHPWLDCLVGDTHVIGADFFERLARRRGWWIRREGASRGLLSPLSLLDGANCSADELSPDVVRFYEETSDYDFDVWSEWSGLFRPFGWLLAFFFSRRLQQLNVPLSPLETRFGTTSAVVQLISSRGVERTAWIRELKSTGNTLYAGSYSTCVVPGHPTPCIRVVFPLPNGNAHVILSPRSNPDGSLTVSSRGKRFGDPGFYFYVSSGPGTGWARYVRSLKEDIHVFEGSSEAGPRADHTLELWGMTFLKLHYRMRLKSGAWRRGTRKGAGGRDAD